MLQSPICKLATIWRKQIELHYIIMVEMKQQHWVIGRCLTGGSAKQEPYRWVKTQTNCMMYSVIPRLLVYDSALSLGSRNCRAFDYSKSHVHDCFIVSLSKHSYPLSTNKIYELSLYGRGILTKMYLLLEKECKTKQIVNLLSILFLEKNNKHIMFGSSNFIYSLNIYLFK